LSSKQLPERQRRRIQRRKGTEPDSENQPAADQVNIQQALLAPETLSARNFARLQGMIGNQAVTKLLRNPSHHAVIQRTEEEKEQAPPGSKDDASARFSGDKKLEDIFRNNGLIGQSSSGLTVIKMQQALVEMGYPLPKHKVDGKFGPETEAALRMFQRNEKIPESGLFDQKTIVKFQERFSSRQPYINNAVLDPADPGKGTRSLSADDQANVDKALVPARGVGGKASTFQEVVGGKKYGDEISQSLTEMIKAMHKHLYEDKEPLRKDPAKNFHDWNVLEKTAEASKVVTDDLYGSYAKGPAMTVAKGNFVDQWEDELARNKALKPPELKRKARGKVEYLIASNCSEINQAHSAVPSDVKERAILSPIIDSFVDSPGKVQSLLDLEIGWKGAQLQGVVYLQRYKHSKAADNRFQLWQLFHTCIHEYIHSLADGNYQTYADTFRKKGDETRYNTLIEGMDDFFTENVRKTIKVDDNLRKKVEGPYYDPKEAAPVVDPPAYPSKAEAEQVVSIVGIRNAQAAYFKGEIKLIGG
jgi:peptidoglycan hydrolase-like protein with peptidoglycan-binding domain